MAAPIRRWPVDIPDKVWTTGHGDKTVFSTGANKGQGEADIFACSGLSPGAVHKGFARYIIFEGGGMSGGTTRA